jgi:hypothetical protein
LNNNRGNNRRRGRGGNRQQGGQQTNRIDSRARGNAPQLLEKYKKLAHDAHLNGDRVQEEYYLQFADHYFRVIADQKQRQEEARQPRREDRSPDYNDESEDDTESEFTRPYQDRRGPRDERGQSNGHEEERSERSEARPVEERAAEEQDAEDGQAEHSVYEPAENPFVRDSRGARNGLKQRRPRRSGDESEDAGQPVESAAGENTPARPDGPARGRDTDDQQEAAAVAFDPSALPPAISAKTEEKPKRRTRTTKVKAEGDEASGEEKPKRRRTRRASPSADGADGALETVD